MDRRDLHSVLRLFAEIASSMNQQENPGAPCHARDGCEDQGYQPLVDDRPWQASAAGEG